VVSKHKQIVAALLEARAKGQWLTTAELSQRFEVHRRTVDEARRALRAMDALPAKGAMHRCQVCEAPAIARGLCMRHYQRARRGGVVRLIHREAA
jgi:hypothetical protein